MIEDLNDFKFEQYLRSRRYSPLEIQQCLSFLNNRVSGSCADFMNADLRDVVERIYSERYRSQIPKHSQCRLYLQRLQDFLQREAAV